MIRVLIVEDALPVALVLKSILNAQPNLRVVGHASGGAEALRMVAELGPDVITMDVNLPDMNGIEITRRIMEELPTPIVIVSTAVGAADADVSFRALEVGAVAVFGRPPMPGDAQLDARARELGELLQAMAEAKLVRRRRARPVNVLPGDVPLLIDPPRMLAVAASTGGPQALATLLGGLPASFPLPVMVVQHISEGFLPGMVDWLAQRCEIGCRIAEEGDLLRPGVAYFAPDGHHLQLEVVGTRLLARLSTAVPIRRHRPSATPLFASVARECGAHAIGLILTGMGEDGVAGLLELRRVGSLTLAQSPASCVIDGMPQAAINAGAAKEVLPLLELAHRVLSAAGVNFVPAEAYGTQWADPSNFSTLSPSLAQASLKNETDPYPSSVTLSGRGGKQ